MYEKGKIQRDVSAQGDSAAMLRELRWTELVTQLAATRDLRAEAARKPDELQIIGRFKSLSTGLADAQPAPVAKEMEAREVIQSENQQDTGSQRDAS